MMNWKQKLKEIKICRCMRVCLGHKDTYIEIENLISSIEAEARADERKKFKHFLASGKMLIYDGKGNIVNFDPDKLVMK